MAKTNPATVHDRIDLERWIMQFPLSEPGRRPRDFTRVTSPWDVATLEQLRRAEFEERPPEIDIPTDIFVFSRGEPTRREVTKLGGLPFRAAKKPWPRTRAKAPMLFLGQLCLADSRDLVSDLPGDVLLVFCDPENDIGRGAQFVCEWASFDERNRPLCSPGDVPRMGDLDTFVPCYGSIHRTFDYPGSAERFGGGASGKRIAVSEATKIGGTPFVIQEDEPVPDAIFLGMLASVQPACAKPFPWINVAAPIPLSTLYDEQYFQIGDIGAIYLWMDEAGKVRPRSMTY